MGFGEKTATFRPPFYPTEDAVADFKEIIGFFSQFIGAVPEKGITMEVFENMKPDLATMVV